MDIVVCFALFLAAMLFCLVKDFSLAWALLFALVLFFALGLRRGYGAKALVKMAWSKMPKSMIVLRILFFIGLLTGLWRSCGTIAFFIYHGIRVITPSLCILVAFLLTVLLSYALGTSFGVASTAGVVLMALARSGGVSEAVTAGVILSGIYFGDRGAPTSSCASLVAALTETDLYGNVRRMFQTAALPYALCLIAYTVLSFRNPIVTVDETMLDALAESFVISPWALVPALIMLILPLLRVPIRRAMAISAAAAFVITVTVQGGSVADALRIMVVGYHPTEGLLASVVSGGGLVSMLTPFLMIPLAALYTGILEGTGALTQAQSVLERSAERIGRFPTMILLSLLAAMVLCNQTIVVMMEHQLIGAVYAKDGAEHEELAMDIANSGVTIAGLIPWCIACAVPLSMLGVGVELPLHQALFLPRKIQRKRDTGMISLLAKKFIKNREDVTSPAVRQAYGMLCGIVGIGFNVLLFALKLIAGTLSGSIAITADAFNNLSDAGASIVTLLGFKLAGQKPDPEHPFGHGRLEYISGLIVSMVILLMGIELAKSAVEKILHPEAVEFTLLTGGILLASILVKLYMYLYNRAVGKKIGSAAMEATAMDSLSDCAATAAVLAATLIGHFTSLQIDGWCGIVVAALVLWAGIQAARDTISPLLGQPPAPEFVQRIEEIVLSSPVVQGIHDLIVHDYGPGRVMISLHAEVPAHGDIMALHDEIDNIEQRLRRELGCAATIHMDPIVTDDKLTAETRERVAQLVRGIDEHITIHDFRMVTGPTHTNVIFDAVVPFKFRLSDHEVEQEIQAAVKRLDSSYFAVVQIDRDYTK